MWSVPCSRIHGYCGSSILISSTAHGYRTKMSPRDHSRHRRGVAERYVFDRTNPRGALYNCVEHRLHVCRRAADNAEHLGSLQSDAPELEFVALPSSWNRRTFSIAITA